MIKKETKIYDRRIIIIDSEDKRANYNIKFDLKDLTKIVTGGALASGVSSLGLITSALIPGGVIVAGALGGKKIYDSMKNKESDINFGEIDYCYENFRFPPQHPQRGIIYSCPDYESDYYIPIAKFHEHSLKLKESAFIEMCAHLGAKEILLIDEVINGVKTEINIDVKGVPSKVGNIDGKIQNNYHSDNEEKSKFSITFPKPLSLNKTEFKSKWIDTEPRWKTIQKTRIENNTDKINAEFSYTDEMGIDTKLSVKLGEKGLNIGGKFNKIKEVNRKYQVTFWT